MESEIRSIKGELRAAPGFKLEGIAAKYNSRSSNLGGFVEQISPGAFTRSLKAGAKVVVTKNHDPNFVLGSTKSGTATVFDSPEGLRFSVQLDKANTSHTDTYASVKRGDIDSCSFAFKVPAGGDSWADGARDDAGNACSLRTLKDVDLIDCSVVTYPAYPQGTQVDARSLSAKGLLRVAPNKSLAVLQGTTPERLQAASDAARRSVATRQGQRIAADTDADLRSRAARLGAIIAADAEQEQKDNEALRRAEAARGIVCGRRSR
jgi:HK97 family phage prohead protease